MRWRIPARNSVGKAMPGSTNTSINQLASGILINANNIIFMALLRKTSKPLDAVFHINIRLFVRLKLSSKEICDGTILNELTIQLSFLPSYYLPSF